MSTEAQETPESLRNRARGKRVVLFSSIAIAAVFAVAVISQVRRGAAVDACAEKLLAAAQAKDAAWLGEAVRTPGTRDRLAANGAIDLAFARPVDSEWSRVGVVVSSTAAGGRTVLVLLLESAPLPACRFLADYETGAFTGGR